MTTRDQSRAVPGRPGRRLRLGQVAPSPAGTSGPTEVLSCDFCRGLVADDENDQSATGGRLRRRCTTSPASGCGAAGSPWSTRPTSSRTPAAAGRAGPRARRAARRDRARRARGGLRRAQRGAARPRLRPARAPAPAPATCAARSGSWTGRASARCTCCAASRRSRRAEIVREAVQRPPRADRAVRHHRRRPRLPGRAGEPARRLGYAGRDDAGRPVDAVHPAGRTRGLRRRPGRPRPGHRPACCAW